MVMSVEKLIKAAFGTNFHEIMPNLYIGNASDAKNKDLLKKSGIEGIVIAAKEIYPAYPSEFTYKRFNIADTCTENIKMYFNESNTFVKKFLSQGKGVLIHCAAGVSRSATLMLAYVMAVKKMKFKEALVFMQKKHPVTCPNEGFRSQLTLFEKDLKLA
eukprot:TRINITY_DN1708_c0_g1_i17.p1 TRINITY_DN1708_c0_g1~~TRINITY_DN1708_c0_g1_i17.p1  ORF type:complete len:159 (-),score=40.40 TRINITY_DN1708_c0_g1_i17:146-622(-)